MKKEKETNAQLRKGLKQLRRRVAELEQAETERKQAEKALSQSEKKYRSLVSNIPDVTWTTDCEGNSTFISPNVETVYGYTPEEIYKQGYRLWFGRIHPDDIKNVKEAYKELFEKGTRFDIEYRIKRKGGKWIWLHDRAVATYEKDNVLYADGVFSDITERKRAAEELRKHREQLEELVEERTAELRKINVQLQRDISERRKVEKEKDTLLKAIETSKEAINITAPDGKVIYTNDAMDKLFGYNKRELIGKFPPSLNAGPSPEAVTKKTMDAIKKQDFWEGEIHNKRKDGSEFFSYARISTVKDKNGKILNFVSTQHDITERKRAEEALRKSEERYRHIVETANEGIWVLDADHMTVFTNSKMAEMLGYTVGEMIGKPLFAFTDDEWHAISETTLMKPHFKRVAERHDFKFRRKDGTELWAIVSTKPLLDKEERYVGCLGMVTDITERKKAEEETRSKIRHIATVQEAAQLAMDADQLQELARSTLRSLSNVMPVDAFAFNVCNPATNELVEILQADIIDGEFKAWEANQALPLENNPLLTIFKSGEPIIELRKPDEGTATKLVPFGDTSRRSASLMFSPMCYKGEAKGIVTVQSYTYNAYNRADLALFADVANVVGVALSRLMAEENLRKSEEIYRKAISFAQGVPYQRDYRLSAFTFVGEGITELTGYSLEEFNAGVLYKIAQESILRGELAGVEFKEALRRAQAGQVNRWQADYRILTRDGQTRWISDSAVQLKDTQGKVIGSLGILQDITERKQAEEELKHVHQIYREVIENTQGVPYRLNHEDGTYEFFGKGCEKLIGIPSDEVTQKRFGDLVKNVIVTDPEAPSDPFEYARAFGRGEVKRYRTDIKIVTPNGEEKWLSDCSLPIFDKKTGQVIASLGILQDITERKRAEEALRTSKEQLRQSQKMEAIGRLAGGVAHDFNNLLTAITGYTELLLNRVSDQDPLRKDIEEIYKAAEAAASLTRQLLVFSRRQMLQPMALDLNAVITDLEKMLRHLIGEDIDMVTLLEANLDRVKADRGQIEQVIMNLAVNARDAIPMPEGGNLTIKTENVTLDEDYCTLVPEARPGKFVCLSVEDTGSGMDKEIIPHIFEPFFTTKKGEKGTGLGLSVVYGIVKQHEGWINVYSEPRQGSTLKVYLPTFSIKQKDQIKKTVSLPKLQGRGERILLVEDEQRVREFTTRVLRENGYVVFDAGNAKEALNIFEREKGNFHLVFSDIVLPDKSGSLLAEQLLSRKPELSVLLCSGYTDKRSQWPLMREKGFRFLQKPYSLADLLQAIREAMQPKKTKPEGH